MAFFMAILLYTAAFPVLAQGELPAQIILVADVSYSMNSVDSSRYMSDALKLAVDLAPDGAQMALIAVNSAIVYESELIGISLPEGRQELKTAADQLKYDGDTNLAVGVKRAIDILHGASQKGLKQRIVLISDISEGGLSLGESLDTRLYDAQISFLNETAEASRQSGIVIDTILLKQAPEADPTIVAVENLSPQTGGNLFRLDETDGLPAKVEALFFDAYRYNRSAIYSVNSTGEQQVIHVNMPTGYVDRARVLVSASTPVTGIQASRQGSELDIETNRSYSMIDIARPPGEGIQLTISAGQSRNVTVYLITDYKLMLDVKVESVLEPLDAQDASASTRQINTLNVDVLDTVSGKSILSPEVFDQFESAVVLRAPDGTEVMPQSIEYSKAEGIVIRFKPAVFGEYSLNLEMAHEGVTLQPDAVSVHVPSAQQITQDTKRLFLTEAVAITVGILIVAAAVIFALARRKKKDTLAGEPYQAARADDYEFFGKLDIYVIWARGGEYEFPPMSFSLNRLGGRTKINLAEVLAGCNVPLTFEGAEQILISAGLEQSIVLKNNSKAEIRCSGSVICAKETVKLHMGQKFYVVFAPGEDEMEFHYRDVREQFSGGGGSRRSYQMQK